MYVPFEKGSNCSLRIDGRRYPAKLVDARERVLRMVCLEDGFSIQSRGIVVEFDGPSGTAAFFTRYLTSAPDNHTELILLRAANLSMDELRSFLRVPTEIGVTISVKGWPQGFDAKLLNISSGGALIEGANLPEIEYGERLNISIKDDPAISVNAEVIHFSASAKPDHVRLGARFVDVDVESTRSLTWFVWKRVKVFFHDYS